ncbi:hypothetical protein ACC810_02890 [Rhizobium ruizarguesonis]
MSVDLVEVKSRGEKRDFLLVPRVVYSEDPAWVRPMPLEREEYFDPRRNPLFKENHVALWVAYRGGKPIGRISAQFAANGDDVGRFGCLECIDDDEAFDSLMTGASSWLKKHSAKNIEGPFSLSINDECGVLTEGHQYPPTLMMPHGRPYYATQLLRLGFSPTVELIAYSYDLRKEFSDLGQRLTTKAKRDSRITVVEVQPREFLGKIETIADIFNDGWQDNWGFSPVTQESALHLAKSVRPLLMKGMVWLAYYDETPAAVAITLPNINEILGRHRHSHWIVALISVAFRLIFKRFSTARTPIIGIRKRFHNSVLGSKLALSVMSASRDGARANGVAWSELSWVLADNRGMRDIIEKLIGGVVYKRYQIFNKDLCGGHHVNQ